MPPMGDREKSFVLIHFSSILLKEIKILMISFLFAELIIVFLFFLFS